MLWRAQVAAHNIRSRPDRGPGAVMIVAAVIALIVGFIALSAQPAFAWGPITHIALGVQVLASVSTLEEPLQAILLSMPDAFLYGSLAPDDAPFHESSPYAPNSPYSASKASSDHLVRAWHHTYGLPTLVTNCSNNYGPYQFPEKLIPLIIHNALQGKPLPVYGDGQQIRDWLFVLDHCSAIAEVLANGKVGETYNVGGGNQRSNLEVVHTLCACSMNSVPIAPSSRTSSCSPMCKTVPATIAATPSTQPNSNPNSTGAPTNPLRPASEKPSSGTSTTKPG